MRVLKVSAFDETPNFLESYAFFRFLWMLLDGSARCIHNILAIECLVIFF